MMKSMTLKEFIAEMPIERQEKIKRESERMLMELRLAEIREELELSQQQLAKELNISQPSVLALEKRGNDIRLSSVKRYVEAMGGKLSLSVALPTGKTVSFAL
ncbi:helix-turn-helix domain-containing protein [Lonepinella koalarum]|uniref:helix-turn-helix domain-containing protein n=1 Tax=Lonepinella TaxID=53416 RepID=UPI0011E47673|nr:helix-turn-helix domain-containing protein [Lonepinella koalarum]TYG33451.1 helix-turn-helix domain-containing protein [Lonepinella koalarum]